ncbi:MAG TPA: hypothetical protein VGH20_15730 [Myxococcales bacterium]
MIRFNRLPDERLTGELNALGRQIDRNHRDLTSEEVSRGLVAVTQSPFNYGLVDLSDEQHLGLLYYWIVQVRTVTSDKYGRAARIYRSDAELETLQRRLDVDLYDHGFYKLAIIGRGSAAAYYVNALGEGYTHNHTLLIGEPDPWVSSAHPRSRGDGYINHEEHLIGQWGPTVPAFSTDYMRRSDFARSNEAILDRIGNQRRDSVLKIEPGAVPWIRIDLVSGERVWAKKVIIATGAGPHAKRGFEVSGGAKSKAVDLDTFMRAHPQRSTLGRRRSVVVHGPNAGIDAVERAGEVEYERILWFMSESSSPVFLSGNRLQHATHVPPTKLIERDAFGGLSPKPQKSIVMIDNAPRGDRIVVSYVIPSGAVRTAEVDLYVYALGQDANERGAVLGMLDDSIKTRLIPIHDLQRRFGDNEQAAIVGFQWNQTTLRYGVEIIGAAALQVAVGGQRDLVTRVAKMQPGTVLTGDQLGTIKSAIGARGAVMPRYVSREVNLSTDDRTVLRTHIAVKYPNIDEAQAQRIIEAVLSWRRTTSDDMSRGFHPLGYDEWWQRHFRQMLEYWNARPQDRSELVVRHRLENQQGFRGRPGFQTR